MKSSELIARSRIELFERPWGRGALYDVRDDDATGEQKTYVCALGAMVCADGHEDALRRGGRVNPPYHLFEKSPTLREAARCVADEIASSTVLGPRGETVGDVIAFNDYVAQSVNDVIDLFDRAEKRAAIAEAL